MPAGYADLSSNLLCNYKGTIWETPKILGKICSSLIVVSISRLYYRLLEKCNAKALKEIHGNFGNLEVMLQFW